MAAINAAGYDTELTSAANHPLRAAVRQELATKRLSVLSDLKYFVSKPYTAKTILEMLHDILAEGSKASPNAPGPSGRPGDRVN